MSVPVLRPPLSVVGLTGASAYELAVANGFVGTEADWLASLQGQPGPPGPASDGAFYIHQQLVPSATWNITHSLGYYPAVSVLDSAGTAVVGATTYHDTSSLSINFHVPFAGTASLS